MLKIPVRSRVVFLFLIPVLLVFSSFGCTRPEPTIDDPPPIAEDDPNPQEAIQEAQLLANLTYELEELYYDPDVLDPEKLYNAALEGVRGELKNHGVDWKYNKIEETFTRYGASQKFLSEYSRARGVATKLSDLGERDLIFAAADKMLNSLGRSHTYFVYPKWHSRRVAAYDIDTFVGIGVVIEVTGDDMVYLSRVCKRGPADRAGLRVNDQLLEIDGQVVTTDLMRLTKLIRGDEGTKVKVGVRRGAEKKEFLVDRGYVSPEYGNGWAEQDGEFRWAVLELAGFNKVSMSSLESAATEVGLFRGRIDGLVIDLRGNPGGDLELVRDLMEWFLPIHTEAFYTENQNRNRKEAGGRLRFITRDLPKFNGPVVILLDGSSASGSEIFSAVMREQGRAVIVGKKSAGAIEVGTRVEKIGFDAEAVITIDQIYTAGGKNFEAVGVSPDYAVDRTKEDVLAGRDPYLDKAKELLRKRCGK